VASEKEIGLLRPAKAPSINAPIEIQIRQISDSIKNINSAIRGLQEKLNELESAKLETFKYLKGRLSKERTAPDSDGEVEIKSSNNTIDAKASGSVLDLMLKQRIRILEIEDLLTCSGNVGIGTDTPTANLHVYSPTTSAVVRIESNGSGTPILTLCDNTTIYSRMEGRVNHTASGLGNHVALIANQGDLSLFGIGNIILGMSGTGRVGIGTNSPGYQLELSTDSAAKPSTNTWTVPSDKRLKKDIKVFNKYGLKDVLKLKPIEFKYNGKGGFKNDGKTNIGFIAQDVQEVMPEMVSSTKHKDGNEYLNVNTHFLTFAYLESIKELSYRINNLENTKRW